jgi:endonuclease YncB( thermonuclease family)
MEPTKTITQLPSGLTVGVVRLGFRGGVTGSVRQQTHDGDTLSVRTDLNFGVRFLGVDAPEISFTLPGEDAFTGLANARWEAYLTDPFAAALPPFVPPLPPPLLAHLAPRLGPGCALNHHRHADAAEDALEAAVEADLVALGQDRHQFRFFLAFASEVMDRYGRFLCYVNRYQPDAASPAPRPLTYNERLLAGGHLTPYFIWPNLDPYLAAASLPDAVPAPATLRAQAANPATALGAARAAVAAARAQGLGVFDPSDPLRLLPFEVRYLARRRPPDRWVIDLATADDLLRRPEDYHAIPHPEDRLFVPAEYVPLFVEAGWRR